MRAANLTISPDARAALVPLLGGDRRASRTELRKLALYAHGSERVELDDVMAVVADASALGLDALVDAAFAGRIAEVEKRVRQGARRRHVAGAIVGTALRQIEQLHTLRLDVESGTSASAVVEGAAAIHFRRKPLVEAALKSWTSERLVEGDDDAGRGLARRAAAVGLCREAIAQRALTHDRTQRRAARLISSALEPRGSLRRAARASVADLQLAALAAMLDRHHEAERIRQPLLQRARVGVLLAARAARRVLPACAARSCASASTWRTFRPCATIACASASGSG